MATLTNLQKEFINQYFMCGRNATEAVIQAGYKIKEPETKKGRATAAAIGYENLRKPHISSQIEERLKTHAMSANEVIARLSDHANATVADFFDFSKLGLPRLNLQKAEQRGVLHLVSKLEMIPTEHGTHIKMELHNSQSALVHLGRYHKLFTDKVEVTDWRHDAIRDIRSGLVPYEDVEAELGVDLATELFRAAGVPIMAG